MKTFDVTAVALCNELSTIFGALSEENIMLQSRLPLGKNESYDRLMALVTPQTVLFMYLLTEALSELAVYQKAESEKELKDLKSDHGKTLAKLYKERSALKLDIVKAEAQVVEASLIASGKDEEIMAIRGILEDVVDTVGEFLEHRGLSKRPKQNLKFKLDYWKSFLENMGNGSE